MKKILLVHLVAIAMVCSGCVGNITYVPEDPANAYLVMIEELYELGGSMEDRTYLAFDFSRLDADLQERVTVLAKAFCKEHDQTYLEGTIEELMGRGYITSYEFDDGTMMAGGFAEGVLFTFDPVSITETEIVSEASWWIGNMGAAGSTFTATFTDGNWQLEFANWWMA